MQEFLRKYNIKHLTNDIKAYGYSYSGKKFVFQSLAIMLIIFFVSYISKLQYRYITILMLFGFLALPFLINAWFTQLYAAKRFQMVGDYLSNIIPIFMQKAKIRYALTEVVDLTSGQMQSQILKAISYLDENHTDVQMYKTALGIIEKAFPNTRIIAAHKLMISVEEGTSLNYHDVCKNMYVDIESWIKRVYTFQTDLLNRRNKLLILCLMTLLLNSLMVYLYVSNEYFYGFTEVPLYQIMTSCFIAGIFITIIFVLTKLHGHWLVDDMKLKNSRQINNAYDYIYRFKPKLNSLNICAGILILLIGLYFGCIQNQIGISFLCLILALMIFREHKTKYNTSLRRVKKALMIEFPIWLRGIALSLNGLTVKNAIFESANNACYPMRRELENLTLNIEKEPLSIHPFASFLSRFHLSDAQSVMKVLFSIQNLSKQDTQKQVSSLILRNQELLDKAEHLRNQDAIGGIEALGFVPIVIFSLEMMCSMFLLFTHMVNNLNATVIW